MSPRTRTRRDGSSRPRRYGAVQPGTVVVLSLVWIALWGSLSPLVVVSGPLVAIGICLVFPLPPLRAAARIHPWGLLLLLGHFLVDLARASVEVSWIVLRHSVHAPDHLDNAVIEVDLVSDSDFVLTGVALILSLVPGSMLVEARRSTHTLYLHVLDVDGQAGVEAFRRTALEQEQRILRAFSPRSGRHTSAGAIR